MDRSGRRTRLFRVAGLAAGGLLAAYLALVGVGAVAGTGVPLTPWPDGAPGDRPGSGTGRPGPRHAGGDRAGPHPVGPGRPTGAPRSAGVAAPDVTSTPQARATPAPSATRPGRSAADPPAYGRERKTGGR